MLNLQACRLRWQNSKRQGFGLCGLRHQNRSMDIKQHNPLVTGLRQDIRVDGSTMRLLLASDLHLDNPATDQAKVWRVFDAAVEAGAKILLNGDTLCAMQGKADKRGSKAVIRPEHLSADYFGTLVDDIAGKLAKYAPHIVYIGDGNHETAILRHNEIDLLGMLVRAINDKAGTAIIRGGYHGFIRIAMHINDATIRQHVIYHHHGKHGGEVTKGVLGVNRHSVVIPDADTVWTGHTHTGWLVLQPRLRLYGNNVVETKNMYHVKTGTAKDDFNTAGGFTVERVAMPPTMVAWMMSLTHMVRNKELKVSFENIEY